MMKQTHEGSESVICLNFDCQWLTNYYNYVAFKKYLQSLITSAIKMEQIDLHDAEFCNLKFLFKSTMLH